MLLVGPALIVIGSVVMGNEADLRASGGRVQGVVTEVNTGREASDRDFKVEYEVDGDRYAIWVDWLVDDEPTIGREMTVVYRTSNPGDAVVEGYDGPGVSVVGLGLVMTAVLSSVAVVMIASFRASRRRPRPLA
ncbi:DUF3592 domain-containing protein [Microbacterium sp. NPDC087665]|uniref:DUF3592 domain-containing protein n=1 Tax=Microbacterium sp. NPDC087665 TaxID=3364194 RepID=UPI0038306C91